MQKEAFKCFINNLISEYKESTPDGYELNICRLSMGDKKLLLSYVVSAAELEWFTGNVTRFEVGFNEYRKHMQQLIDDRLDEVYQDFMHDNGYKSFHHSDNGELGWYQS